MGQKSRKKQIARQEKEAILRSKTSSKFSVFRSKIRGSCLFIGALILGVGVPEMIAGRNYAPYLISFGAFLASLVIVTDDDIRGVFNRIINVRWIRVAIYILICLIFTFVSFTVSYQYSNNQREELAKTPIFYGELTPGDEPDPYNSYNENAFNIPTLTPIPKDAFRVMFGDDSGIYLGRNEEYTFALRNQPFLKVKFDTDGKILIDTQITDSENHYIAKVEENVFQANPQYAFRPRQPNKYTLIVQDWDSEEVLNIKYLNPNTLWVTGKFFSPIAGDTITIHASGLIDGLAGIELMHIYMVEDNPTGGIINIGGQYKGKG